MYEWGLIDPYAADSTRDSDRDAASRALQDGRSAPPTVLLVEDEASVRVLLLNVLVREGFQVLEAADGNDAWTLFDQHRGHVSLLLTDVIMPNMNGPELAEKCLEHQPDLRVLFISGFCDERLAQNRLLDQGVARFVAKPFSLDRLITAAREMLDWPSPREQ